MTGEQKIIRAKIGLLELTAWHWQSTALYLAGPASEQDGRLRR